MEMKLHRGDYISDGAGGLERVGGQEALLQRVLFRLTAKRGTFAFQEELGSRLWTLGRIPAAEREAAAKQFVVEALAPEREVQVRTVSLKPCADGATDLTAELDWHGERLSVTLGIRG